MQTLCALVLGVVIWNGFALMGQVDAGQMQRRVQPPGAYLTVHGRLLLYRTCLPMSPLEEWHVQAAGHWFLASLANAELVRKAEELQGRPVSIYGYLKDGVLVVQSVAEDTRPNPEEAVVVQIRGRLSYPEAVTAEFSGLAISADGRLFWLDLGGDEVLKAKAEKLFDREVIVTGKLERRQPPKFGARSPWFVVVTDLSEAFMR
jgi:hypothetical protein